MSPLLQALLRVNPKQWTAAAEAVEALARASGAKAARGARRHTQLEGCGLSGAVFARRWRLVGARHSQSILGLRGLPAARFFTQAEELGGRCDSLTASTGTSDAQLRRIVDSEAKNERLAVLNTLANEETAKKAA